MPTVGRLKNGDLYLANEVNERLPVISGNLKIRYIRDSTNGSSANTSNHWVEIQAIDMNGTNVALNKSGTSSAGSWNALLTNNVTTSNPYWGFTSGVQWVQVDLGDTYELKEVKIWHYYADGRTYRKTKTEVSADGKTWHTIFDSEISGEYVETSAGKTHSIPYLGLVAHYPFDDTIEGYGNIHEGLQGWWKLDGDFSDSSGNGYHGNGLSSPILESGKVGQCYSFMNGTNYSTGVDIPNKNFTNLSDFTMSAWIKPKGNHYHYDGTIISSGNWNSSHWSFGIGQSNTQIKLRNPNRATNYTFTLNEWHHVTYLRSGTTLKLYVNGIKIDEWTDTSYMPLASDASNTTIGRETYAGGYFVFNGSIDDVRVYERSLSESEIQKIVMYNIPSSNTNTILTEEGIAVEESTTNVVPNPTIFSSGWTSYSNGNDGAFITEFGTEGLNIVNRRSWCGAYKGIALPSTGTYTISVWVKPIMRTNSSINITLYTSGGGISDTNVSASWDPDKIGKWQKISMTRTYTTTNITLYLICFGGSNVAGYEITAQYTMPQIELRSFSTAFTNGTRGNGNLKLPVSLSNDFTIAFKFKPEESWYSYHTTGYGRRIMNMYDKNTTKKIWFEDYHSGGTQTSSDPWIGFDEYVTSGSGYPWHWHSIKMKATKGTECFFAITKRGTTWKKYILSPYSLTMQSVSVEHTHADVFKFSPKELEFVSNFNFLLKDVSVYNIALSDEEINKLAVKKPFLIGNTGNLIINEIVEKPNNIPHDTIYLPLDFDGKDQHSLIKPSVETNAIYEKGSVWVGTSTTNVVTNTNLDTGWSKGYCTGIQWNDSLPPEGINSQVVSFYDTDTDKAAYWYCYGAYAPQVAGKTYTVSMYVKTRDPHFSIKFYTAANGEVGRYNSEYIVVPNDGKWHRIVWNSFTNASNSVSRSLSFHFTFGAVKGEEQRTWFCAPQMEEGTFASPFVNGTRGSSSIEYNASMIDISKPNWTIFGFYNRYDFPSDSYFLDKVGSYSLRIGNYQANPLAPYWSGTGGAARSTSPQHTKTPSKWKFFAMTRNGGNISIYDGMDGIIYKGTDDRGAYFDSHTTTGWKISASTGFNGYLKNIGFVQKSLSDAEIESIYDTQMRSLSNYLQIQNNVKENTIF